MSNSKPVVVNSYSSSNHYVFQLQQIISRFCWLQRKARFDAVSHTFSWCLLQPIVGNWISQLSHFWFSRDWLAIVCHVTNFPVNTKTGSFGKMMLARTERAYSNYLTCEFSAVYLTSSDCNGRQKWQGFVWEKQLLPPMPVTVEWFSIHYKSM